MSTVPNQAKGQRVQHNQGSTPFHKQKNLENKKRKEDKRRWKKEGTAFDKTGRYRLRKFFQWSLWNRPPSRAIGRITLWQASFALKQPRRALVAIVLSTRLRVAASGYREPNTGNIGL